MTQAAALIAVRAQVHAWRGYVRGQVHERRWKLRRYLSAHSAVVLVLAGGLGALAGGWLIGRWCLGLVLIAESVFAIYVGLNRDDGTDMPIRGARTVAQVLEDERYRPDE
jgi:hypothetical protein